MWTAKTRTTPSRKRKKKAVKSKRKNRNSFLRKRAPNLRVRSDRDNKFLRKKILEMPKEAMHLRSTK